MDKNRENRFFHVFPSFLTESPLHLESDCTQFVILFWKVYLLLNRSAAAPMGIRSRAIARVMVPSSHLKSWCIKRFSLESRPEIIETIVASLFVSWLVTDDVWRSGTICEKIRDINFDSLSRLWGWSSRITQLWQLLAIARLGTPGLIEVSRDRKFESPHKCAICPAIVHA